MKKFWPLLVIVLLILTAWTTHYIQFTQAKNNPLATMNTLQGSDDALKHVRIDGSFENTWSYSPFTIRDGALYAVATPLFRNSSSTLFQSLQQQYASFMRGKDFTESQFYPFSDGLLYVEMRDEYGARHSNMSIERLQGDTTNAFTVELAFEADVAWTTTQRITVQHNDTLYALITVMYEEGNEQLYGVTIDVANEQLISLAPLATAVETEKTSGFIHILNDFTTIQHEDYFAYMTGDYQHTDVESAPTLNEQVHVWNTLTNTHTKVTMPENVVSEARQLIVQQNQLIVLLVEKGNIVMHRYNLDTQQWLQPVTINTNGAIVPLAYFNTITTTDHVYVAAYTEKGPMLVVFDTQAGETRYVGRFEGEYVEHLTLSLRNAIAEQ